jgi:hypothetical protein
MATEKMFLKPVKECTIEELEEAIKIKRSERAKDEKPKVNYFLDVNVYPLQETVQEYVDYLTGPDYHEDNEWQYWIYEQVINLFCPDVWEYMKRFRA